MKTNLLLIQTNRAFSLVEVLVSMTILLLVVVTPMTVITRANNSTAYANEQMIAFFLAQEGLELIEKGRNDLYLQDFKQKLTGTGAAVLPWNKFLALSGSSANAPFANCYNTSVGCSVHFNGVNVIPYTCNANQSNCRIYKYNNRYTQVRPMPDPHEVTKFTRVIRMAGLPITNGQPGSEAVKVTSTVSWRTGSLIASQQVELVTYLANTYGKN